MVTTLRDKVKGSTLYEKYLSNPKLKYIAPESRYRYLRTVNSFLRYTNGDLSREKLVKFMETLGEHSVAYQRWSYQVLKGFYDCVGEEWPLHPRELPPEVEPERPYLETDEAQRLLELAKVNIIDHAMFRLVLVTGIRKGELRELNTGDYIPPRITIRTKKHGEKRIRTLDEETVKAIDAYVDGPRRYWEGKHRGLGAPLFLSTRGARIPDSTLTKRFRVYMKAIGKPRGCGMHSLRRTCVTWESEAGMDSMRIQKLHGWKSSRMPEIYARLKPAALEKESYEGNPLIGGKKEGG